MGLAFEIFQVAGNQPTYQRNRCLERAQGHYIYFLDNDSHLPVESLQIACQCLKDHPHLGVLGGPSLPKLADTPFQTTLAKLFSSYLASGPSSSRYKAQGAFRDCDDRELILCNLIVKKSVFDKMGLFNESLYPNEENEFIARVLSQGTKVCYHPDLKIHRSHRENYGDFYKQMFNYGRGRAEQTKISPKSFKPSLLLPIVFPFYLFLSLAIMLMGGVIQLPLWLPAVHLPLLMYLAFMLIALGQARVRGREIGHFPLLFFLMHISYGLGFVKGLLFSLKASTIEAKIYHLNHHYYRL